MMKSLSAIARFAARMTREAGAVALQGFRAHCEVENKNDNTAVTRADRECEAHMRKMIEREFPAHGVVGEEFGANPKEETWVLDPIDGTLSFITGSPLFCVLAAFLRGGKPIVGVIHMPALDDSWVGIRAPGNSSATFNGQPCQASDAKELGRATCAVTTAGWQSGENDRRMRRLISAASRCRLGGDGFNYGCVASGFADVAADYDMAPYDYLAPAAIVGAAGGIMTDWNGNPLALESGKTEVIAAASEKIHRDALTTLIG